MALLVSYCPLIFFHLSGQPAPADLERHPELNTFKPSGYYMQRRIALQYLPIAFALSASPGQLMDIARRARECAFIARSAHEKLLVALADCLLPATSTPSASEAGVPAFIQLSLDELVSPEERDRFYARLDQFEEACITQFALRFEELTPSGQEVYLTYLMQQHDDFCIEFRQLTLTAYFTSQPGMTQALAYNPIPGSYNPCLQVTAETKAEASYF